MKFNIENGVLKGYDGQDEVVVIPEEVRIIGESVFENHIEIKEVKFPSGLKEICSSAFCGCESLEEVILPEGLVKLGSFAFNNFSMNSLYNTKLKRISIPASLQNSGEDVFTAAYSIEKIEIADLDTWLKLDNLFFWRTSDDLKVLIGGKAVNELVIPEGVTTIKKYAFFSFKELRKIILPSTLKRIEEHAFSECELLEEINIPDHVEYVGKYAFKLCNSLTSLTFSSNVTEIEAGVCAQCNQLKSVKICSPIETLDDTFSYCKQLETVQLPEGLKGILFKTFSHCESLKTIDIPASVEYIATDAFVYCSSLNSITYGGKIKNIRPAAFRECKKIKELRINPKERRAAIHYFGASKKLLDLDGNLLNDKSQAKKQSATAGTSQNNPTKSETAMKDSPEIEEMLRIIESKITLRKLDNWAIKNKLVHASLEHVKLLESGKVVPKEIPLFVMYSYMSQMEKTPSYNKQTFKTFVLDVHCSESADQIVSRLETKSLMKALLDAPPIISLDVTYDYNWKKEYPIKLNKEFKEVIKDYEDYALLWKSEIDDTIARALPYGRYADEESINCMIKTMDTLTKGWSLAGKKATIVFRSAICLNETAAAKEYCKKIGVRNVHEVLITEQNLEENRSGYSIFTDKEFFIKQAGISYKIVFKAAKNLNGIIEEYLEYNKGKSPEKCLFDAEQLKKDNEDILYVNDKHNSKIEGLPNSSFLSHVPNYSNPLSKSEVKDRTISYIEAVNCCLTNEALQKIIAYVPHKKNGELHVGRVTNLVMNNMATHTGYVIALCARNVADREMNIECRPIYIGDEKYEKGDAATELGLLPGSP